MCHAASSARGFRHQLPANALEIVRGVHADGVITGFHCLNAIAVLEHAQLLERLGALERCLGERGKFQQEGPAVAVEAYMLVRGIRDPGSER